LRRVVFSFFLILGSPRLLVEIRDPHRVPTALVTSEKPICSGQAPVAEWPRHGHAYYYTAADPGIEPTELLQRLWRRSLEPSHAGEARMVEGMEGGVICLA